MNFVEIVNRQLELQKELQELQQERIASDQAHEDVHADHEGESISVGLDLKYESKATEIITLKKGDTYVSLSVEDFNEINQFLGMYNDAIFSYMSEITKVEEDVEVAE